MLILALDTSSAAGSAALVRDGAVLLEREGDASRTHGERLPLELMAILRDAGVALGDVDRFAVVTGPGSFTGLRVGIATIQGLALARRKLVTPVSAFEASIFRLKPEATDAGSRMSDLAPRTSDLGPRMSDVAPRTSALGVWIDAHRREVFGALYAADGATIEPPTALSPDATLDAWMRTMETGARVRFAGDGAVRYAGVIRARLGERADLPASVPPLAGAAGRIAAAEPARGVVPHAIVPLYVRRSDAELARDRARVDRQRAAVPQGEDPRP
jgi:tRNA threonylcarbamoyladenosine biosynthesis protein TsaB